MAFERIDVAEALRIGALNRRAARAFDRQSKQVADGQTEKHAPGSLLIDGPWQNRIDQRSEMRRMAHDAWIVGE